MAKMIAVDTLGECRYDSPFKARYPKFFTDENGVIRRVHTLDYAPGSGADEIEYFQRAGAREKLFFKPEEAVVGIVTCGGLCPGLNNVIRAVTFCAVEGYGVKKVLGFQYGYLGLAEDETYPPLELSPDNTDEIHEKGGTILKSSRGPQDADRMVAALRRRGVNILVVIGGDGTLRGARDLQKEIAAQGLPIAVVGVPKTIDNDIGVIERSFGFETAVQEASAVISCAHAEAKSIRHGVGLVKLMGRESGWIAASAATSNSNVNFCLVPEVPFDLEGPRGFFECLRRRLEAKDHAVVVVAEGAGQQLAAQTAGAVDRSGNRKLQDIGLLLKDRARDWFARQNFEVNIKYFDPSYSIRSTPANANDAEYCLLLGYNALHAGMAGKTGLVLGLHNHRLVHLPIHMTAGRKLVDPQGWLWQAVLQATRQPVCMHGGAGAL
ncbi:MAG: ATP-dependent 6-phosphofructokinase [Elusimicrobiales bacterium]|nr:ATP-dependent 6-phosphofructokinase [Elusimicrobiales bacterium]